MPITFESTYPYPESEYLDLWAEHLWNNAGILVLTSAVTETLRTHLNGIFDLTGDDGQKYFFRFYDPRVMRAVMPSCTGESVSHYFGPISHLLVEAEAMGRMLAYRPAGGEVEIVDALLMAPEG